MKQTDLKIYGAFFSYVIILVVNILVLTLVLSLVFVDEMNIKNVFIQCYCNIINIYKFVFDGVSEAWTTF
jgi:hypothetical protein